MGVVPGDRHSSRMTITAREFDHRQALGGDRGHVEQRRGRTTGPSRCARPAPARRRDPAGASGQRVAAPVGAGSAIALVGAVFTTLALLHLTATPTPGITGPAAHTDRYAHRAGLVLPHSTER